MESPRSVPLKGAFSEIAARPRTAQTVAMKAIVYDHYGAADVLRLTEVSEPEVRPGGVLVRVRRAALNPKDALFRKGKFRLLSGTRFPKRSGLDLAGVVVTSRSPAFLAGQRVFGFLGEWTALRGTLAELVACRDNELALTPSGVEDEAAAAIALVAVTALQALRDVAALTPGQRVLVNGASGGVGTVALQIARLLGAEVHSVSSAANRALCEELGVARAWTYPAHEWKEQAPFDVIFDVFGNLDARSVRAHMTPRGRFVSTVPSARRLLRDWTSRAWGQEERLVVVRPVRRDLELLAGWLADGSLRAIIDARYPLVAVKDAFARLESKRARGKIVVEVG